MIREPRHDEGHLHAPVLTQSELLGEQRVDGFEGVPPRDHKG